MARRGSGVFFGVVIGGLLVLVVGAVAGAVWVVGQLLGGATGY